jgi:hypothetical protein
MPPPPRQQPYQPYQPRSLASGSVPVQRPPVQQQPYQPPAGEPAGYQPWRPYQPAVPPPGPPPGGRRRSGSNAGLWTILLLLLAGAGAGIVLLLAHPLGDHSQRQAASTGTPAASRAAPAAHKTHPSGAAKTSHAATAPGATAPAASAPGSAAASPAPTTAEGRAAANVASMLSQSASDRSAIIGAASDIGNCGPSLNADAKVFDDAAASRQAMLGSLSTLTGRDTLPPALVGDLTRAWRASMAADQAYAKWANDEVTQGCVRNDTSDPGYRATVTPDRQATEDKDAFVALWNPLAAGYGLTQYSSDQF